MPQRHDVGQKKRAAAQRAADLRTQRTTPEDLARSLVRRGLASPVVAQTTIAPRRGRHHAA